MKTLDVTVTRQINGGRHYGFNGVQDPIGPTIGPITTNPVLPIDDIAPGILQKIVPLVKMNILKFSF